MAARELGRTGLQVSPIGFGAFKIGRNEGIKYPSGYELPDQPTVDQLLNGLLDEGIRLIDTAPAYGVSEERIGHAIGHRRDEYVLSTKVGETFEAGRSRYDFSRNAVRASVERSLQRLRTDTLDLVLIHASADDASILQETDVVETLEMLRKAGTVRAIGLSGKTVEASRSALHWADVLMIEYHPDDRSHGEILREAQSCGVGVLVKKGLASGRLDPAEAIAFSLAQPAVCSLVVGSLSFDHMCSNLRLAHQHAAGRSEA